MQTFLPYADFNRSAACLDRQRLGKQRVEVLQLLRAIRGETAGWANHPAAVMWRHNTNALVAYGIAVCRAWCERGYKDTCAEKINVYLDPNADMDQPLWLGHTPFHESHQSNLVRKLPAHYLLYFPHVASDLPYLWPSLDKGGSWIFTPGTPVNQK